MPNVKPMAPLAANLRTLRFMPWTTWTKRETLPCIDLPGVYALQQTQEPHPATEANPLAEEVVYIGVTAKRTLRKRWTEFDVTAFQGRNLHAGGKTYRECIGGDGSGLYVAAMGLEPLPGIDEDVDRIVRSAYALYLERKLLLDYVMQNGRLPLCNKR